jgi:hypothetical protein
MPTPASPNPITLDQIQTEFGGANPIGLNEYYLNGGLVNKNVAGIPGSGAISISSFRGKSAIIASYLLVTSSGTHTLPAKSGTRIFMIGVAGGGGGGGGNGRTSYTGSFYGGGGGGSGGIGYGYFDTASAGPVVTVTIGGGGAGGGPRDGPYPSNPGAPGAAGSGTTVVHAGVTYLSPGGGGGGFQTIGSGTPTGNFSKGGAGGASSYRNVPAAAQNIFVSSAGITMQGKRTELGGPGARGLNITINGTAVDPTTYTGLSTNASYGVQGVVNSSTPPSSGTGYGGGGSGGGCTQSDVQRGLNGRLSTSSGNHGAVLLWWGR